MDFESLFGLSYIIAGIIVFCLIIAGYITFVALEAHTKRIARACEDTASMQHAVAQELARANDLKTTELKALGILGNDRNKTF